MPMPPAAFSPLTTTKSSAELLAQPGQQLAQRPAAGGGDDVADEEDGRHALHGIRPACRVAYWRRDVRA